MTLSSGNPMRIVLLTMLIFEVVLFGLAVPVMIFVSDISPSTAALLGGAGMLLALVAAALMRKPIGYLLGWLTQLAAIALGASTWAMYVVGGMFGLLWVITFVLGKRLDAGAGTATADADSV
ncbi:MAG TPA: DUF4233 domain-containing protein [Propionibacteriaceae bacterium]|nr:DUF4233 domain-containing protein [Propionibacteriaceae bacterium]